MLALLLCIAPASAQQSVPEPAGLWTGPMQGSVPATIAGGTVVTTAELTRLIAEHGPVLVDVGARPHKPDNVAAENWSEPPHRTIPNSVWLPGVGAGELPRTTEGWFRVWLKVLTDGDQAKPVVFFCHPNCWGSWNAAKRAILYGYKSVHWYPGGIEGWQDDGQPTEVVKARTPPS